MMAGLTNRLARETSARGRRGVVVRVLATVCAGLTSIVGIAATTTPAGAVTTKAPAAPAAAPIGPFTLNVNNRQDVAQFYNLVHEASNGVPDNWNGSIAGCNPGTVSPAYLTAVLSRTNYFRTMAGEPDVTFNGTDAGTSADPNNAEAQAAALMESANNFIPPNHTPPQAGTTCWTQQAFNGSSHSSLFWGETGPGTIDGWVLDRCATCTGNEPLGHRRNMLDPSISVMGYGSVPATPGFIATASQIVLTTPLAQRPPVRSGFVAWPPAGFVPYEVVFPRWSFSLPNTDFSHANVTMQSNGASVPVQLECFDPTTSANCGQFGEPMISWIPNNLADGAPWPKPTADQTFTVNVTNAIVNGAAQNFTYTTTIIDPAVLGANDTLTQSPQGSLQPPVNSNPTYTVSPAADASGYQWQTAALTPGDLVDGAENGLVNFTANVSPPYNPISTVNASVGTSSFRLSSQGVFTPLTAPALQTLTLNPTLLASASSQITFDSLYFDMGFDTPSEVASVDVSTDGGTTWTSAFSESPPPTLKQTAFVPKVVPLGQFAGQQIRLRFALTHTSGSWGDCCAEPNGWYIDNISLSNVQDVGTPTLSAVGATPSFVFTNPTQGPAAISVRPQFSNASFGSSFGAWSPALVVTTVGSTGLTSLASSANPSIGGQQVTYTATVAPTDGGGTVSFTDGGTAISGCQSLALTAGQATCAQTYSLGATHPIVATYSGDTSFTGSSSPTVNQVVNGIIRSSVSMVGSMPTVTVGQLVTFTATVTPTDSGGTMSFFGLEDPTAGCTSVPLNALGQATCVTSFSNPRVESDFFADYTGDANFTGEESNDVVESVSGATTTSLLSSVNPSTPGQQVTYTATVAGGPFFGGDGVSSVAFSDNGTTIAGCGAVTLALLQATCAETPTTGPHTVVAVYSGYGLTLQFAGSTSNAVSQSVGTLSATTTSVASSANPSTTGQQVTYTATVASSDGGGTVSFTDSNLPIAGCQAETLTAGQATCAQTYTDTSPHSIVAVYSGDATFAGSSSSVVGQTVNATPAAAPASVGIANLGNGVAQVGFTAPTNGILTTSTPPSNVTGYNVYEGTSAGHESTTPLNPSRLLATSTGYTVLGLASGTKYFFIVRALNAAGVGAKSAEVSATPATAPSAPRKFTAKSGKESAVLKWTAPSTTGGIPITGYNVYKGTVAGGESTKPVNAKPLKASVRTYTVTGLTDGITDYFIVRATNAVAGGAASAEASATPATIPGAPAHVLAYAAKASALLTWVVPQVNGGSVITGFNVFKGTSSGHESTTPVNPSPLAASATGYTVTGLTNGTKYFFTIEAINAVGKSPASTEASATPTTASTPPSSPRTLAAHPGTNSVGLTWTAPASNGGKPITGYNVYVGTLSSTESTTPVNPTPLGATATSYTVTGLTNATKYYFTVKAINSVGVGAPSGEASATPEAATTVPAAPRTLTAAAGSKKATLTWLAPAWNGGSAITGYNVYKGTVSGGESSTPVNPSPLSPSATSYSATGLTTGTRYYFIVKAINANGTSAASNEASAIAT